MSAFAKRLIRWLKRHPAVSHQSDYISSFEKVQRSEREFYIQLLKSGMTVFDVGANVGDLTLLFSHKVAHLGVVHAFEPTPASCMQLRDACHAAQVSNVRLNQLAVGERVGTVEFHFYSGHYHPWNTRAVRPLANYGITNVASPTVQTVECTTLDAYCDGLGISQIDLLKIDVEGAELEVLWGAERLLKKQRIRVITFEFGQTTFDMGHTPLEIASFLESVGYVIRNLMANERPFPGGASVETAAYSVHIATPADDMA